MKNEMEERKCEHKFELQSTSYQYPSGYTCTVAVIEYAYLVCAKCGEVVKKQIHEI